MKRAVSTNKAPGAIGPYSQGIAAGPFWFFSGQTPLEPSTGEIVSGDVAVQADRVLRNIQGLLEAEGLTFDDVVKATVFVTDMAAFGAVNEVYKGFFGKVPPARSFVAVAGLPKGALVEIEVVAYKA